jgi:DNA-binding NtrC family response regulator
MAVRLADAPFPILIEGETGTGKYELALLIHERSSRSTEPFVDIHCANLSETLFEATLFGSERGAFTDARERRFGRIEAAGGGTILFDEVDCLSLEQQAKLLRVIDRRRFERIGGNEVLTTTASVLFATNRDLSALADEGLVRRDFLSRVSCVLLRIPPLRERKEDILLLATLLLEEALLTFRLPRVRWSSAAMTLLKSHSWPGNVRELKTLVHLVAYLHSGGDKIDEAEVAHALLNRRAMTPTSADATGASAGLAKFRTDAERQLIVDVLKATAGNRVRAARLLKIGRRTLQQKIAKYGL